MKIMTIFGTRPEGIKVAPVIQEMANHSEINSVIVNTGQHKEMLDQVLNLFDITPTYNLEVMKAGQSLGELNSILIEKISKVIEIEQPDYVFVHGDTATTFAGAFSAYVHQIPVGHIEAGLRTNNIYSPFPEEINRQLVGRIAIDHFAPTNKNKENLLKENIDANNIHVVGNTVIDALLNISERKNNLSDKLNHLLNNNKRTILLTTHRRENLDDLHSVYRAIQRITDSYEDVQVIFPIHKNPVIREKAQEIIGENPRVHLIDPLEYEQFVHLMKQAYLIITDSGGIQEEAPGLGIPVLVARDTTERPEGVEAGTLLLVGTDEDKIVEEVERLLSNPKDYQTMSGIQNPFGQGDTAKKIVNYVKMKFK